MGQRSVGLAGLLGLLLVARTAAAQEVDVQADAGADAAAGNAIADAVRQELRGPGHRRGAVAVRADARERTLRVVFTPADGTSPLERTVPLPADAHERARVAAFLARNLSSDEADALLRDLQKRAEAEHPVAPPAEPPLAAPAEELAPVSAPVIAPVVAPIGVAPPAPDPCAAAFPEVPVALALFSPLALPSTPARAALAYGALYGDLAEIRGLGTGVALRVRCSSRGVVVTALGSVLQGRSVGLVLAGAANVTTGKTDGAALSAGLNLHTERVRGVTASSVTIATGDLEGAQIGLLNIGGAVTGAQVGLLNIGASVRGAQIGIVNIAGPVTGAQVGILNVAKEVDAAVAALVSISWAHRIRAMAWLSTITPLQIGVVFEGKRMYAGVSFGRLLQQILAQGDFYLGAEIGVHAYTNTEHGVIWDLAISNDSSVGVGAGRVVDLARLGTRVGYRVLPRFAPYVYAGIAAVTPPAKSGAPPPDDFDIQPEVGAGTIF